MNRRSFLQAILAAGVAPAVVGSGILMPIRAIALPKVVVAANEWGWVEAMVFWPKSTIDDPLAQRGYAAAKGMLNGERYALKFEFSDCGHADEATLKNFAIESLKSCVKYRGDTIIVPGGRTGMLSGVGDVYGPGPIKGPGYPWHDPWFSTVEPRGPHL